MDMLRRRNHGIFQVRQSLFCGFNQPPLPLMCLKIQARLHCLTSLFYGYAPGPSNKAKSFFVSPLRWFCDIQRGTGRKEMTVINLARHRATLHNGPKLFSKLNFHAIFIWLLQVLTRSIFHREAARKNDRINIVYLLRSLTLEATPSATQIFKRSYKISHNPGSHDPGLQASLDTLPSFAASSKKGPDFSKKSGFEIEVTKKSF